MLAEATQTTARQASRSSIARRAWRWSSDTVSNYTVLKTQDLEKGVWVDSEQRFDQMEMMGGILTTSHADPLLKGSTFYRLIYAP